VRVPRSSLIAVATSGSVGVSVVISVVWFVTAQSGSRFEPAVAMLGLLAGLIGVLTERRVAAQERRHVSLTTLADELRRSAVILADPRFTLDHKVPRPCVYPRLPVSATDAALISGALAERSDTELLQRLHNWRDEVNEFNRRLGLTEIRLFTVRVPAEIAEFERALHRSDGYLSQMRSHLHDLRYYLAANYPIASGRREGSGADGNSVPLEPASPLITEPDPVTVGSSQVCSA
jgi:hypothetical protein